MPQHQEFGVPECTTTLEAAGRRVGPVKVLVTDRPHRRTTGLVDLTSGASALLAWFPASWASKIAPKLLENAPENAQKPQEINITCPKRSYDETPVEGAKQLLQAVKFAAKKHAWFSPWIG